jgi:hypothetical protein
MEKLLPQDIRKLWANMGSKRTNISVVDEDERVVGMSGGYEGYTHRDCGGITTDLIAFCE